MDAQLRLDDFRGEKAGPIPPGSAFSKVYVADQIKADGSGSYTFTISTGAVDRDRDTIAVDGWRLDNFMRAGGPVLWAHQSWEPPIGKAAWVRAQAGVLKARVEFAPPEISPLAGTVRGLIDFGALRSTSVGFIPLKSIWNEERRGFDFIEQELLEFSIVPVPSNPDAIQDAKAAGLDLAPWRKSLEAALYSLEPGIWIEKADVERSLRELDPTLVSVPVAFDPEPHVAVAREVVTKRGRVLSASNEERIRSARDASQATGIALDEVLASLPSPEDDDKGALPAAAAPATPAPAAVLQLRPSAPLLPITPQEVHAVVSGALKALVEAEVRRHTGRVEE